MENTLLVMRVWAACSTKVLFCAPVISSFTYRYYRGLFVWKHKRKSGLCPIMKPPVGEISLFFWLLQTQGVVVGFVQPRLTPRPELSTEWKCARDTIASKSKNFPKKRVKIECCWTWQACPEEVFHCVPVGSRPAAQTDQLNAAVKRPNSALDNFCSSKK